MFRGRSYHSIDEKGRIAVPARFREPLRTDGETQVVVTNYSSYLVAFPLPFWLQIEDRLNKKVPFLDNRNQKFIRLLIGSAEVLDIDKQGRILIPPALRDFAHLVKDVALVGMGNRFEIWNKEAFDKDMAEALTFTGDDEALRELAACLTGD